MTTGTNGEAAITSESNLSFVLHIILFPRSTIVVSLLCLVLIRIRKDHMSDVEKIYNLMKEDRERRANCRQAVESLLQSIKEGESDYSLKLFGLNAKREWWLVDASLFIFEEEIFNNLIGSFLSAYHSMRNDDYLSALETLQNSTICKLCRY